LAEGHWREVETLLLPEYGTPIGITLRRAGEPDADFLVLLSQNRLPVFRAVHPAGDNYSRLKSTRARLRNAVSDDLTHMVVCSGLGD
jgi:hypothetical protein